MVKNQVDKRTLRDCWQWKAYGQCSKGDNCSFRHDINKRAKMTQPNPSPSSFMREMRREPEVPEAITSKELAPIHSVKSGILQNACSTSPRVGADLAKSALVHIARLTNNPAKCPKKW